MTHPPIEIRTYSTQKAGVAVTESVSILADGTHRVRTDWKQGPTLIASRIVTPAPAPSADAFPPIFPHK